VDLNTVRVKELFSEDFKKIEGAKVLLLGVGGVGGVALECLYRSGVRDIVIVDFDTFEESNQNRQLGSENVGVKKVEYFKERFPTIRAIDAKVTKEWCEEFDFEPFDLVIDAIDDMRAKVEIACRVSDRLISSMGSAKRVDPTKIEIKDISKTYNDPLAKKFRYELRKRGFNKKFDVVFSTEEPKCKELGSFMGVTGSFGLYLCSKAIERLIR
jgi:tRNA A37 threonylcarbamoyladenosine dehydratase